MASALPAACDQNRAAAQADGGTPHATAVLAATILASSLAFIDGSVVNVALPAIGHSLGAVARSGGMIATALLGAALAVAGDALVGAFHAAAWVAAGLAAAAGVAAALLVTRQKAGS